MIEEHVDQVLAGALGWVGRWRDARFGAGREGRERFGVGQFGGLLLEELEARRSFRVGGFAAENLHEGLGDKPLRRLLGCNIAERIGQLFRQDAGLGERQGAVGHGQGLLRGDALAAAVAFDRVRAVEERQELHLLLFAGAEVQASPRDSETRVLIEFRPAASRIERPGHGQRHIADRLGLQPPRVGPPVVLVLGIDRGILDFGFWIFD